MYSKFYVLLLPLFFINQLHANELLTNAAHFSEVPKWVTKGRVDRVVDHVQKVMEWDIHRVEVTWYHDNDSFLAAHNLGPSIIAFSRKNDNTIHIGPKVTTENFDQTFGHELVHIISFQKYKEAIPKWLEEGLANYVSKTGQVKYKWLAQKPFPKDIRELSHPITGTVEDIHYHYLASQALTEMLAKKCDLPNLLRLSVGTSMEGYIETYCGIKDLNVAFQKWVKDHP